MTETKKNRRLQSPPGVTLADIGREAGVSISIVSRVLKNREDRIPETTRERVRQAANRLGYLQNLLVQGVQTGRSMNIGVIIPPVSDYSAQIVQGIGEGLRAAGYCMILTWSPRDSERSGIELRRELVHALAERRVDGIILRPTLTGVSELYDAEVLERNIPLVTVDRPLPGVACDFSGKDDELGGRLAARHLLEAGHRKLLHITEESDFEPARLRRKGFEEECAAVPGASFQTVEIASNEPDAVHTATAGLLGAAERPTGVFLGSDHLITGFRTAARRLDLRIPDDVSVLGFGNLPEAEVTDPPLSSMEPNGFQIGLTAARMVLRRIEQKNIPYETQLTTPVLVKRASVAEISSTGA